MLGGNKQQACVIVDGHPRRQSRQGGSLETLYDVRRLRQAGDDLQAAQVCRKEHRTLRFRTEGDQIDGVRGAGDHLDRSHLESIQGRSRNGLTAALNEAVRMTGCQVEAAGSFRQGQRIAEHGSSWDTQDCAQLQR
ncbi:MAG: hypothetical protein IT158_29590 [Bryobacterales bacterium]|nr:hypothetical protein [Bryobacterales bacterium]